MDDTSKTLLVSVDEIYQLGHHDIDGRVHIEKIRDKIINLNMIVKRLESKLHEDDCMCGSCPMFRKILGRQS